MDELSFQDIIAQTKQNIARFQKIEGKPWGIEGAIIELTKQVGQLSALVMNREGYYFVDREKQDSSYLSADGNIGDELADILFAVVRIASHYDIDLVALNAQTRRDEDKFLREKGV
jgi:NTP pyrophosphatase (non-canonical NTP hydrolase)